MFKPGAGAVKVDIDAKVMTLDLNQTSSLDKTAVHINLFNKYQRFAINDTQGTLTNIGLYAAPPPPVPQIRLHLNSWQFTQHRLFKLIHSHIPCVSLSERITEEIAKQAKRNIGFLLQFYHMSVHVDLTQDLFVAVPVSEEETQKEQDEEEESTCAICLEALLKDEKLKLLHCPHRFHLECISEWLLKRNSCPLCRETVFEDTDCCFFPVHIC